VVGGVRVVVVRGGRVVVVVGAVVGDTTVTLDVVELGGVVELFDAFTSATTAITATTTSATARTTSTPLEPPRWSGWGAADAIVGSVAGGAGTAEGGYQRPSDACHQPSPPDWSDTSISPLVALPRFKGRYLHPRSGPRLRPPNQSITRRPCPHLTALRRGVARRL
jgi:hypothetical protein